MPQNTHLELASAEADRIPAAPGKVVDAAALRVSAAQLSQSLAWLPSTGSSSYFTERCTALAAQIQPLFRVFKDGPKNANVSDDYRWLHDNLSMIQSELTA